MCHMLLPIMREMDMWLVLPFKPLDAVIRKILVFNNKTVTRLLAD